VVGEKIFYSFSMVYKAPNASANELKTVLAEISKKESKNEP